MTEEKKNIAASVRQRLYNISKASGEEFNLVLGRYANERWLYRLSVSTYRDRFYLKGASRLNLWFDEPHRPTRDVDLLGSGSSDVADLRDKITEICAIEFPDGLTFDPGSVRIEEIRAQAAYPGLRAKFTALLNRARIGVQVDVGFGDAVTPAAETIVVPTLLDLPAPELLAYPKETVVAEKFEAIVKLGIANSRMKDFWDLRLLIDSFEFEGPLLQGAILTTFDRRGTPFPQSLPLGLTDEFAQDDSKRAQWKAFVRTAGIDDTRNLQETAERLREFFSPIIDAGADTFERAWNLEEWRS